MTVDGDLTIASAPVSDLDPLSCIRTVTGDLRVTDNLSLEDISGLSGLTGSTGTWRCVTTPSSRR